MRPRAAVVTDATFAGTLPAIIRSSDHRYTYNGVTYPGVTDILKVIDKSGPLMAWAARQTAEAAIDMAVTTATDNAIEYLVSTVGRDGAVKALASRANWKRDEAAALGSQVHAMADDYVSGRTVDLGSGVARDYVQRYADWWSASGWTLRLSEAVVVHPDVGYGGTFDLLARDADGRTVLADIKTGRTGVYKEAILQLCAYGMAPLVSPMGSDKVYPMPIPDRYVALHVTAEGVREIEVVVGQAERMAFLDCVDLHRWIASVKGKL